ncbi:MAG: hypothetical protein Fur0037_23180 [Planctomycetota bacterium]
MRVSLLVPALLLGLSACRFAPGPGQDLRRSIWVDRWDYQTATDIERILADCRRAGFSSVFFQVRGNGTVAYRSRIEVWSERFGFRDPGFDPLETAVAAAHRLGLSLHAWINVLPGWAGKTKAADPRQLSRARPDWFLAGGDGAGQVPRKGKYLTLNPCLPEVRAYLASLAREIVESYAVDGLHLDYARFPDAQGDDIDRLGTDPRTLSLFTAETGRTRNDAQALRNWQTLSVTRAVEEISSAVRGVEGRSVLLSAAVFADPDLARRKVRQDWPEWARRRLVDAVVPMNYTESDVRFDQLAREDIERARGLPVIIGIGAHRHASPDQTVLQMESALSAGAAGVSLFNYRALFGERRAGGPEPADLRRRVASFLLAGR